MAAITKEQLQTIVKDILVEQMGPVSETQMDKFQQIMEGKFNEWSQSVDRKYTVQDPVIPANDGFPNIGEFAKAVYTADKTHGRVIDPRLLQKAAGTPAQSENDMEGGGYLIPEEFRSTLLQVAIEKSDIMSRCTIIPMATNAINIPVINGFDRSGGYVHGGVLYYWVDEEGGYTSSNIKFGRVQLRLKKVIGMAYTSDEIMEDSPISITPLITSAFSDGLVWTLDDVFITGTGVGKPLGALNAPCKITVAKETGQAATTIVTENVIKMYARIWRDTNAIWMANRACIPQLATMSLAVGAGGIPVYLPANGISGKPYSTLFGLPLVFSEHCSALGTAGDIILVDWSQYLVGQKAGGPKTATSIHLKFDYDQQAFKISLRLDGEPWWPAVLTPHRGGSGATLSPIVELAVRA